MVSAAHVITNTTMGHFTFAESKIRTETKGGKVTSAGWQVTLCDLIWHVISRSGVVISITNCYIRFLLFALWHLELLRPMSPGVYPPWGLGVPIPEFC